VIRYSNLDFRINPEVCWIAPKMHWIHFLVDLSHFAEGRKKSTGDCMRNANKSPKIPYSAMVRQIEVIQNPRIRDRITTKM